MTGQGVVVELFAGPGGISEALRMLGFRSSRVIGFEKDRDACLTARAAGHQRVQADVSMVDIARWRAQVGVVAGLLGGPPCQSYSSAGKQKGKLDRPRIEAHIARIKAEGRWLHYSRHGWHDDRSPLVLEMLRWALELRPEWIVLEQVPQVLPLWQLMADVLRDHGWNVDTGALKAEQYGVAQTRRRALLVASRVGQVNLPVPTHRAFKKGVPQSEGDPTLLPWVSMAEVLGRGLERPSPTITAGGTDTGGAEPIAHWSRYARDMVLRSNYSAGGPGTAEERGRTERELTEPATTVTSKAAQWALRSSAMGNATVRGTGEPAPTITGGHDHADRQWFDPSDPRGATERLSVVECAVIQSFRPDYPWRGGKQERYRQVGDAAPPVLMAAAIREAARLDGSVSGMTLLPDDDELAS